MKKPPFKITDDGTTEILRPVSIRDLKGCKFVVSDLGDIYLNFPNGEEFLVAIFSTKSLELIPNVCQEFVDAITERINNYV